MNTELKTLANEIKSYWTSNYSVMVENNLLTVYSEVYDENNNPEKVEAGWIDDKGNYGGNDEDVVEKLKYMLER